MISYPEQVYRNRNSGGHWFDAATMRFFGTRINETTCEHVGNDIKADLLFVTSEKPPHGPRAYAVRRMDSRGDISGPVGEFKTRSQAVAALKRQLLEG